MPDVAVARIDLLSRCCDRHVVLCGVVERVLATADIPLTPGGNHGKIRSKCGIGELEPNLIVAFAGASVSERVCTNSSCHLYLAPCDERTAHRGAKEILPAVDRAGAESRPDEILDELLAEILDVAFVRAGRDSLRADAFQLISLADIGSDTDDASATVMLLEPRDDD